MSKLAKIMSLLGLAAFLAVSFVPPDARFARSAGMSGARFANGARTAGSGALAFRWAWLSFARLPAPPPMSS